MCRSQLLTSKIENGHAPLPLVPHRLPALNSKVMCASYKWMHLHQCHISRILIVKTQPQLFADAGIEFVFVCALFGVAIPPTIVILMTQFYGGRV